MIYQILLPLNTSTMVLIFNVTPSGPAQEFVGFWMCLVGSDCLSLDSVGLQSASQSPTENNQIQTLSRL